MCGSAARAACGSRNDSHSPLQGCQCYKEVDRNWGWATFCDTPEIFAALHYAAIGSLDVLGGANNRERHSLGEDASMFGTGLIIRFDGRLVNADVLRRNDVHDL